MQTADEIIERVLGGDLEAYAGIVDAFQDDVRRVAAFGLDDHQATEDIVQQVFVNAYFHLETFERGRDFGRWIRAIARNLLREELRRRSRYERRLELYRERLVHILADDEAAERREEELRAALAECRGELSPEAERVLDLRYGRALGFDEIAGLLGRTATAARQMLTRIRLALRHCIEERMVQP